MAIRGLKNLNMVGASLMLTALILVGGLGFYLGFGCQQVRVLRGQVAELDLTEEQSEAVRELVRQHDLEARRLRRELEDVRSSFVLALADPNTSEDDLRKRFSQCARVRDALGAERFQLLLAARRLIGPERMAAFEKKFSKDLGRRHGDHQVAMGKGL